VAFKSRTKAFDGFSDGVNNVYREESVPDSALRSAKNIDLLSGGKIRRRQGFLRRSSLTDARSAVFFAGDIYLADQGDLKRVSLVDFSEEPVANVDANAFLSFAEINGQLYITDGVNAAYKIAADGAATAWAVEQPAFPPALAAASLGGLPAATYQVNVTYFRGREESGTGPSSSVTLTQEGGIELTDIPVPLSAQVTAVRIYVSTPSGELMYAHRDVAPGTTSAVIAALPSGKALETQFLEPVPAGHIIRGFNGRSYSAVDNVMYYSQAMRPALLDAAHDYIDFESRIRMIRPVEGGVFVSTEKRVVFLAGEDPENFQLSVAHTSPAVEGSDIMAPAKMFSFENMSTGEVAVWWAASGIMVIGFPNGQVVPVREGELALPEYARGDVMIREENGVRQLVSVLQRPKTPTAGLAMQDEATVTVHRRGIEL